MVRQSLRQPLISLSASITMKPAMMAFVVAIAWMMLPAMPLASNSDCSGMPKQCDLRFAAAATTVTAKGSSLVK